MGLADSISSLSERISGEEKEEEEIETDEDALEQEIQDVMDKEETVKEELSYASGKKMNYYPQAINHTKEIVEEIEDAEEKVEEIENLIEDIEARINNDEQEINSDIVEIEDNIRSIQETEEEVGGLFSGLEEELRDQNVELHKVADKIIEMVEKQHNSLERLFREKESLQKNDNDLYTILGHIYDLADAVRREEEEIGRLENEVGELESIFEHLETAEQHSVQLIKKEKSLRKVQDSESVTHTKEAVEKGEGESVSVYSDKESTRIVDEEAKEIRSIEERTSEAAEQVNNVSEKVQKLANRDRNFSRQFQKIVSALEDAESTVKEELEEAKRFEKMLISARDELEEAMSKYKDNNLEQTDEYQELDRKVKLYKALHDEGRGKELERLFNGEEGIIELLEELQSLVENGLDEAEKVSSEGI